MAAPAADGRLCLGDARLTTDAKWVLDLGPGYVVREDYIGNRRDGAAVIITIQTF